MRSLRLVKLTSVAACAFVLAGGGARAQSAADAVLTVTGGSSGEQLGTSVSALGDVDGDGVPDLVVGTANGGYALVVSGKDGSTIHTLKGSASDQFGFAVAGVGDTDGDGVDDILVGAPLESGAGAAHLYSGRDASVIQDFYGDNSGDAFGSSVAGVGDLDGDGNADVIVGAPLARNPLTKSSFPGMVQVYLGNSGKNIHTLYGDANGDNFGVSVCGAGDVDGDGTSDFAVGADLGTDGSGRFPGYVRVFSGGSSKQITTLYGTRDGDSFGISLVSAGDLDSDKVPDLVVGAEWGQDTKGNVLGYATLFSASSWKPIITVYGDAKGDLFGHSVAAGGDVDGDGTGDVVVGAPGMVSDTGEATGGARVFSGADGSDLGTTFGLASEDLFGWSVALVPDVTGDGLADLLVGSPYDDTADTDAGAAFVVGTELAAGPSGGILINGNAPATATASVTLALTWTAGDTDVSEMRVRDAGAEWGDWIALASTIAWTLPTTDGTRTVEAQFRDGAGLESAIVADSILLDRTAPTGTVTIAADAPWVGSTDVTLTLSFADTGAGVARMRVRNAGTAFGQWVPASTSLPWTVVGAGTNVVEAQFEDAVGNVSAIVSDSVGVDLVPPTGSVVIAGAAEAVRAPLVSLTLSALDTGGSGLSEMRLRQEGASTWGPWQPFATTLSWSLSTGSGVRGVEVQFRDLATNESPVYSDGVFLDPVAPFIVTFRLHEKHPFFLPQETISFDLAATDPPGGAGIASARTTWDGGATWTPWTDAAATGVYTPARPPLEGEVSARVVVRDGAGNESEVSPPVGLYIVEATPPDIGSGGSSKGGMSGQDDVDVIGVDLVQGDLLNVSISGKAKTKKHTFVLALDLARPDGQRLVQGRFPTTLKSPGIKGFEAPATGRYLLVVRHGDTKDDPIGSYSVKVSVKHAKPNGGAKATTETGELSFDAAAGSKFSATLSGAGLDPATVTLEGPNGPVAVQTKTKKGKVTVVPVTLTAGTGTYTLRFTSTGPVTYSWKATLPKPSVKLTEE